MWIIHLSFRIWWYSSPHTTLFPSFLRHTLFAMRHHFLLQFTEFFFSIKILIKSLYFQIIRPRLSYCTFFVDFCIWCRWQRFGNGGTARVASVRTKGCPMPDTDTSRHICIGLTTGHSCTYQESWWHLCENTFKKLRKIAWWEEKQKREHQG